ncbi:hypothetical protein D1BOALGB6SA_1753 [Olavius sp. associated proteobacterium Delta 1]|nr:hypothetical protein D1BOALGB6SA_1753 [Olavius sp. associated proteobacterium Delta 1]
MTLKSNFYIWSSIKMKLTSDRCGVCFDNMMPIHAGAGKVNVFDKE